MGLKERFAESYAKSKTMSGPEKRANEIMGKLLMKKSNHTYSSYDYLNHSWCYATY